MKPFKFRVWDNINKVFCFPDDFYIDSYGNIYKRLMCSDRIIRQNNSKYETSYSTGIFDKNGKEVFEGDIIRYFYEPNEIEIVEYSKDDVNSKYHWVSGYKVRYDDFEIIGSKYENPELLDKIK